MPVVLRESGFVFFFFSNEGTPRELCHIHVRKGEKLAKLWLEPEVAFCESFGFSPAELKEIFEICEKNLETLTGSWNEYFSE